MRGSGAWCNIVGCALICALITVGSSIARPGGAAAQTGTGEALRQMMAGEGAEVAPAAEPPPPRPPDPDPWFHVGIAAGAVHQAAAGFGLDGFRGQVSFSFTPLPLRLEEFVVEPVLAAALDFGSWSDATLFGLGAELGLILRYGRFYGVYGRAVWAPTLRFAHDRGQGALSSWRAHVGAVIHPVRIGVGWSGAALDNDFAFHVYELVAEWCF